MFSKCVVVASLLLIATHTEAADCDGTTTKIATACDCATSGSGALDGTVGSYCLSNVVYAACTADVALSAACACGSQDNSLAGDVANYASGKVCTKGANAATVGTFGAPANDCDGTTTKIATACDCATSGSGASDGTVGSYCLSNVVYAACTADVALSAACACGSQDNSLAGDVANYASGKVCTKGANAATVGTFGAPAATPSSSSAAVTTTPSSSSAAATTTPSSSAAAATTTPSSSAAAAATTTPSSAAAAATTTPSPAAAATTTPSPAAAATTTPSPKKKPEPKAPAPAGDVDASSTLSTGALAFVVSLFAMAKLW